MKISIKWTMREPLIVGVLVCFLTHYMPFLDLVNPSYSVPLVNTDPNWKCFGTNLYLFQRKLDPDPSGTCVGHILCP